MCSHCYTDLPTDNTNVIATAISQRNANKQLTCPKCGGSNIFVHKKGFSVGKGCLGFLLLWPIALIAGLMGLLFGAAGANKIKRKCLNCDYTW